MVTSSGRGEGREVNQLRHNAPVRTMTRRHNDGTPPFIVVSTVRAHRYYSAGEREGIGGGCCRYVVTNSRQLLEPSLSHCQSLRGAGKREWEGMVMELHVLKSEVEGNITT